MLQAGGSRGVDVEDHLQDLLPLQAPPLTRLRLSWRPHGDTVSVVQANDTFITHFHASPGDTVSVVQANDTFIRHFHHTLSRLSWRPHEDTVSVVQANDTFIRHFHHTLSRLSWRPHEDTMSVVQANDTFITHFHAFPGDRTGTPCQWYRPTTL